MGLLEFLDEVGKKLDGLDRRRVDARTGRTTVTDTPASDAERIAAALRRRKIVRER